VTLDLAADSGIFVGDFGESVGFRLSSLIDTRTVTAVVNRMPISDDGDTPFSGRQSPVLHVLFRNHATLGVLPSEVVADASQIETSFPMGATARWRNVLRIVRHNAGTVLLEVQA